MTGTREDVVLEAETWIGTEYHHMGTVKGAGVDCAQILVEVYFNAGVITEKPVIGDYPIDWMLHRNEEIYLGWLLQYGQETDNPQPGDVVVWRVGRCFSHAGIIVEWPTMIHAYRREDAVVYGDILNGEFSGREMKIITFWGN